MINMKIKLAHPDAKVPTKNNFADAGWDLYAVEDKTLSFDSVTVVKTGIHIQIPRGFVGLIWDRSGMSIKNSIHRVAGVIDSGYAGELMIGLTNLGHKEYKISSGDKIAQLVVQEVPLHVTWETVEELDDSDRGDKGFGSSGK
jgi:dUTP pyrophosphatase